MSMLPFGLGMDPLFDLGLGPMGMGMLPSLGTGAGTGTGTRRSVFPASSHGHVHALAPIDDRQLLDFGRLASDPLPVDVEDRENEYLVRVHQRESGMKKKDLRVDVEHGMLTIRGERESESGDAAQGQYSRHYRSVSRSMALPENIDENKIEARYEGNNLMIHVPKTGATGGRRSIQIGGGMGMGAGAGQAEHKQAAEKPAAAPQQGHGLGQVHGQSHGQSAGAGTGAGAEAGAPSPHAQTSAHHGQGQGQGQGHQAQSQGHHA